MIRTDQLRETIRRSHHQPEAEVLKALTSRVALDEGFRVRTQARAVSLIQAIRSDNDPGLMEVMLAEYGLSTDEGVALMCLAEALLRVPDPTTMDDLIEDKIAPSAWNAHLGRSSSSLVNASTWALMLTGKVLADDGSKGVARTLHSAIKRLGEPVIRLAVQRAMREMGNQFVLGETIEQALDRAGTLEAEGFTYSYDMLGEAALTAHDASAYFNAYLASIKALSAQSNGADIKSSPGISIKLSALHPRYEMGQYDRVMKELSERVLDLCLAAKEGGIGLNIDAEEADRLDLSLDLIERVLQNKRLAGWHGFGVVVQAYGKRAASVIDWLYTLSRDLDRKIMVRLVKGAYWDTEIKRAQVEGLKTFPVFTRKAATDVSYIACARLLLDKVDRIYPQFATHNAHTIAAILEMGADPESYEFQRLHGMGEVLHRIVMREEKTRCRIYAPVGAHRDLLAYLVRRLLENGANSSFVNQIVDRTVPAEEIAADPFLGLHHGPHGAVLAASDLYRPERRNSRGFDLRDPHDIDQIEAARIVFRSKTWEARPLMVGDPKRSLPLNIQSPFSPDDRVGTVYEAHEQDVQTACASARTWDATIRERAKVLNRAADLYEENFGEIFALLCKEAGKTLLDALAELREAVDFLRFYAAQGLRYETAPSGVFACISPWNFPLAIFTGQIAAALAAGNGVVAKPADATPLIADLAVKLLHQAGVPLASLQLLPGPGGSVGATLVSHPRIDGVCFTGSTKTAQSIHRLMAETLSPHAPLIAETGGLNAMIVDSTALPQQAVADIIVSAFQSAGQRCSALRILYVQEDIAADFLDMLYGAIDELRLGDPWDLSTDIGPVIHQAAQNDIEKYVEQAANEGRLLKRLPKPESGTFVAPSVIRVEGFEDLTHEVFGPVLHVATFKSENIASILHAINAKGYGLTFGLHTRIDDRVEEITSKLNVGNMYINRNQIGAIVGSQPFGGEGLSGTGPKAGGPHYLPRFKRVEPGHALIESGRPIHPSEVQARLDGLEIPARHPISTMDLPGPTGESNRLSTFARGCILCLGPGLDAAGLQVKQAKSTGCSAVGIGEAFDPAMLKTLSGFDAVVSWAGVDELRALRIAMAAREGKLIPLLTDQDFSKWCYLERHVCIDTTASGGNAALLAEMS